LIPLTISQLDRFRANVPFQPVQLRRPRDRHDPRPLREQPGQSDLGRSGILSFRDVFDGSTSSSLARRLSSLYRDMLPQMSPPENDVERSTAPVSSPCPSGLKGTRPMPSSSRVGMSRSPARATIVSTRPEERPPVARMGTADRRDAGFGESEACDLTFADELLDGAATSSIGTSGRRGAGRTGLRGSRCASRGSGVMVTLRASS
jgi:hypothetical protein